MREKILNAAIAVLTLTSITVTTLVVRRELFSGGQRQPGETIKPVPNYRLFERDGKTIGPSTANVTIVVFSDFQCPYCKRFSASWRALEKKYPNDVRLVFHHFPLTGIHPFAREAALFSECMNSRGRFPVAEQLIFENQDSIGSSEWSWFAKKAGVSDSAWVRGCVNDSTFRGNVNQDESLGHRLPVLGTPTVIVNGLQLPGTPTFELLDSLVSAELKKRSKG